MIAQIIGAVFPAIADTIDKAVPDRDEARRLKAELHQRLLTLSSEELQAARDIIVAEASGHSWLQRNWRPSLMLWFAGLVGAHWLGWTAPNLSDPVVIKLLGIVQVGIGGYVVGRSAEKIAPLVAGLKK